MGLIFVCFLFATTIGYSQTIPLNSTETLAVPTATSVNIRKIEVNVNSKQIEVTYRFLDSNNNAIPMKEVAGIDRKWKCFDLPAENVANCTGLEQPYKCCTGVGTGTDCFGGDLCWSNSYADDIKSGEVDNKIGKRFLKRIWDLLKVNILTAGNDGTLPN